METLSIQNLLTDQELVQKITGGEPALFEILIRRYNGVIYKIGRAYGLNHQDTEDMMQETHVAAFSQLHKYRGEASYKTWVARIMVHQCYHKIHFGSKKWEDPGDDVISQMAVTEGSMDTEKFIANRELTGILEKTLESLPVMYRGVFVLREIEGFSVAETADLLGISSTNVKVRLNRAKAMLQKKLEQYYSAGDLYGFHLKYCDAIVENVFRKIRQMSL